MTWSKTCLLVAFPSAYSFIVSAPSVRQKASTPLRVVKYQYGSIPSQLESTDKKPLPPLSFDDLAASPWPDWTPEVFAGALLGFALYLGPDSFLAPLGIESRIQPGRSTSLAFGRLFNSSSEFVVDAEEGFRAEPTTSIVAANVALYFGAGIGAYRVLLSTFDDPGFVCALAACAGIAGTVYEILRPKRPTREEAQANDLLQSSFEDFASNRIQYAPQGAVHKTEVVAAFRRSVARYRTASASGVSDPVVEKIVRYWFRNQAGISMTPAGFYRGCVLKKPE